MEPLATSTEQSKTEDSNMSHLSNETVETPGESGNTIVVVVMMMMVGWGQGEKGNGRNAKMC